MRKVALVSAIAWVAGVLPAEAQQAPAEAAAASSHPFAAVVNAVRDKLGGTPAQASQQPQTTPPAKRARSLKRTKRSWRRSKLRRTAKTKNASTSRRQALGSEAAPWPRSAPLVRKARAGTPVTVLRTRVVQRQIVDTINIGDQLLPLPAAETTGMPIQLNVPTVGMVEVPEDRYRPIFDLLVSRDSDQQQKALKMLRDLRDATQALRQWARTRSGFGIETSGSVPGVSAGWPQ